MVKWQNGKMLMHQIEQRSLSSRLWHCAAGLFKEYLEHENPE